MYLGVLYQIVVEKVNVARRSYHIWLKFLFVLGEMNEMESDCESIDSGLETGNSNLETSENGFMEGDTDSISDGFDKRDTSGTYDLENLEIWNILDELDE